MTILRKFSPFIALIVMGCSTLPKSTPLVAVDYVDPFIGTDGIVHTFPGATYPFGMVQLSPDGGTNGWNWCSGYHTSDSSVMGFSHTHLSGTGWSDLGDILVMATVGEPQFFAGPKENPDLGYRSRISHAADKERASAGYYSVELLDYGILAELTASPRTGVHRYTFPKSDSSNIIIDPNNKIFGKNISSRVVLVNSNTIEGYSYSTGWGGKRHVYFTATFSKPFEEALLSLDSVVLDKATEAEGRHAVAALRFKTDSLEAITVKVGISAVSQQGARANLSAESEAKDFDTVREDARQAWQQKLSKYEFDGSLEQLKMLYTGLYHIMIQPNLQQDVDGKYFALGKELQDTSFTNYSTFSLWDTHRGAHPLLTITESELTADVANSLISRYYNGGQIPLWELCGHDNTCMIGYPAVSVISDAILKGIPGIDPAKALKAMVAASNFDYNSSSDGPSGIDSYRKLGYVKAGIPASVSKTAEYSYYDWCIAKVAEMLDSTEIAKEYYARSYNFMNHYSSKHRLLMPKDESGNFIELDFRDWESLRPHYVSGNVWAYSYFYPHALDTMMVAQGGKEAFVRGMDSMLNTPMEMKGEQHVDISGFFGHYGHGDEPGHQFLYLYNMAGEAWKAADWINVVADSVYSATRNGMPNNDDCGQMSAWHVLSSMGFYPVCPGDSRYIIGTPMVKRASIHGAKGKTFTMIAPNLSTTNRYIESCTLDGEPLTCGYITYNDIIEGKTLRFTMASKPNKELFKQAK